MIQLCQTPPPSEILIDLFIPPPFPFVAYKPHDRDPKRPQKDVEDAADERRRTKKTRATVILKWA